MFFIITGLLTFILAAVTLVATFLFGPAAGLTGAQAGITMLVCLFAMYQSTRMIAYEGR